LNKKWKSQTIKLCFSKKSDFLNGFAGTPQVSHDFAGHLPEHRTFPLPIFLDTQFFKQILSHI
jgi:hypothetical protein